MTVLSCAPWEGTVQGAHEASRWADLNRRARSRVVSARGSAGIRIPQRVVDSRLATKGSLFVGRRGEQRRRP